MTSLIFIELNEINFDLVRLHIESGANLPALAQLMRQGEQASQSEEYYEYLRHGSMAVCSYWKDL